MYKTLRKILDYISLVGQIEDFDEIHNSIVQGISFKGTNIWILVCAIIIASVGLNTNSTAVIIGAMLISPLMGPINGMGYSIAIYDFGLFRQSLKNFGFAVLASLIASTIYFAITPVNTAHSELLARTSPTIFDVLIALFGGFAGIIAISSKMKGNVIPGVAIATALMPPLCTAGYGLGTLQFSFFYGAIYLFIINTVCIAFAAVLVSQMLKLPIRDTSIGDERKKQINQLISLLLLITILPSVYLGYLMSQNEKFKQNAEKYTQYVNIYNGNYLLKNEVNASKKEIRLVYGGSSLTEKDKNEIVEHAKLFSLTNAHVTIEQGLAINLERESKLNAEETSLRQEIMRLNLVITAQEEHSDSIQAKQLTGKQLLSELTPLFPEIVSCSYSDAHVFHVNDSLTTDMTGIFTITSAKQIVEQDRHKIKDWLIKRLQLKDAKVYFDKEH